MSQNILYSFRRCPYAMRGRLSILKSGSSVELREILLRDKAPKFLETSPKGTVPVLVLENGEVIEESLEIMEWAYGDEEIAPDELALVKRMDAEFKPFLDRYKYPTRHENLTREAARADALSFPTELDQMLEKNRFLFGETRGFADIGTAPFIRQFAHVDRDWFLDQDWKNLIRWYHDFVEWDGFKAIMGKYPKWEEGDDMTIFPPEELGNSEFF